MTTITTTKELSDNIIAQMESTLNQTIPLLPKSFIRVMSKAVAAVYILLYKYIGFGILQGFVATASNKPTTVNGLIITPLQLWGNLIGVQQESATRAELLIDIDVEIQIGSLPAGSPLIFAATGVTYITLTAIFLDAPVKQVSIRAVANQSGGNGAGAIGNLEPGAIVSFVNPLPNVARDTTVVTQTVTGADGETTEAYRQRIIDRFRAPPQGGALTDYRIWGVEPAGIVNVYPYRSDCPGQVDVYVEATPESSGDPDGFPTGAQLQEVLDSINFIDSGLASRRPVNDLANTFSISRTVFDVDVIGLNVDDPVTVQAQITTAIEEYMAEREPFIVGLDFSPRLDKVTQTAIGGIVDDIVSAAGGFFTSVAVEQSTLPVLTYSLGIGEKAKTGTITFI